MKPPNVDAPDGFNLKLWIKDNPFWAVAGGIVVVSVIGSALIDNGVAANDDGAASVWIIVLAGAVLYFLPFIIARKKHNSGSVFVVNLFLGWTIIGWIVALAMAANNPPAQAPHIRAQGAPSAQVSTGRTCPFCAEDIKPAAIVCKHCRRDLPAD